MVFKKFKNNNVDKFQAGTPKTSSSRDASSPLPISDTTTVLAANVSYKVWAVINIEEVMSTIYNNINQGRPESGVCIPELKVLDSLLDEHSSDTKQLGCELGEDHPVSRIWAQREDQIIDEANWASRHMGMALRNY